MRNTHEANGPIPSAPDPAPDRITDASTVAGEMAEVMIARRHNGLETTATHLLAGFAESEIARHYDAAVLLAHRLWDERNV